MSDIQAPDGVPAEHHAKSLKVFQLAIANALMDHGVRTLVLNPSGDYIDATTDLSYRVADAAGMNPPPRRGRSRV